MVLKVTGTARGSGAEAREGGREGGRDGFGHTEFPLNTQRDHLEVKVNKKMVWERRWEELKW